MKLRSSKRVRNLSPEVPNDGVLSSGVNTAKKSKRGQGKKRKTREEDDSTENPKPTRRPRIRRGELGKLVEMPLDVLYEIFGRLEILDLMHLARTTKDLRSVLMSRSSISVWKSVRSKVFGLPDCPDDLSEPQYATLMFVTRCSFCQKNTSDVQICWYGRFRYCTKCVKLNFTPIPPVGNWGCYSRYCRGYPTLLANWVPLIKIAHETPYDNGVTAVPHELFILESTDKRWKDEYLALKDPKSRYEWLFRNLESRYAIQKHAHACATWHSARHYGPNDETMQRIFERDAQIMNILNKIRPDLYKIPPTHSDVLDTIYKNGLYGSCLAGFSPLDANQLSFLLNMDLKMTTYSIRCKDLECQESFDVRKYMLSEIYNNGIRMLPINSPSPSLAQIFHIAEDHGLLGHPNSTEDVLHIPFSEAVALWRKHVDSKLIELIANACGSEYAFDPNTVFDLATTFFSCSCCRTFPLTHDQAARAFNFGFGAVAWGNVDGSVQFYRTDQEVMQRVVEMCGLDPKATTARQMDELNPIFECRLCNSFEDGRATMSWTTVLSHQRQFHNVSPPEIDGMRILGEPEAAKVRERIREEQARMTYKTRRCPTVCPHCRSVSENLKLYREHLKKDHEISKFKYDEILYSLQENRIPPMYRLWPPLDEESGDS